MKYQEIEGDLTQLYLEGEFDVIITPYHYDQNHKDCVNISLGYEALTRYLRKTNRTFKGKHIGLPKIGCGLVGGDWTRVKQIIQNELKDCNVTIVNYKK